MSKAPPYPPQDNQFQYHHQGQYPNAPPSYDQATGPSAAAPGPQMGFTGGVPPVSPYTPQQPLIRETRIITTLVPVGDRSTHMVCPSCHQEMNTKIKTSPGIAAWILSCICCMVGCFCGCCLIPFCVEQLRDVHHTCPKCGAYLGKKTAEVSRLRSRPVFIQPTQVFSREYTTTSTAQYQYR